MKMQRTFAAAVMCLVAGVAFGQAQSPAPERPYPEKQIQWVVPFLAGSTLDTVARLVTQRLAQALGQPIVVDNKSGAGGNIGAEFVAKAPPDGHIVLYTINSIAAMPALYPKLPFDPARDLAPVGLVASMPYIMVVNTAENVNSVKQFMELAKSKPGQLAYGSSGVGSLDHLAGELFNSMVGTKILHVPYKGGPAVQNDLMAGRLNVAFTGIGSGLPHIKSGKLKVLAVTTLNRARLLPDVPTLIESGLPGYDLSIAHSLFAPAKTPRSVVLKLNEEVNKVLRLSDIRERLDTMGLDPMGGPPENLGNKLRTDIVQWKKIVDEVGIRPEN